MTATATNNALHTVIIDGHEVTADLAIIQALLGMESQDKPKAPAKPKAAKPKAIEAKPEKQPKPKHSEVLDTKRVERMVKTATDKLEAAGFEVKASKQGTWVWVYPCGKSAGKGRAEEFKSVKLAKGWVHSPKRGAFRRDFAQA